MHVALNILFRNPRAGGVEMAAHGAIAYPLNTDPQLRLTVFAGADDDLDGLCAMARSIALLPPDVGFGLPESETIGRGVPIGGSDRFALAEPGG